MFRHYPKELTKNVDEIHFTITSDCKKAKVIVSLIDQQYGLLDTVKIVIPNDVQKNKNFTIVLIGSISIFVIGICVFGFYFYKKRRNQIMKNIPTGLIVVFFSFVSSPYIVHADTFVNCALESSRCVTFTVNINKTSLAPNETITVTATAQANYACGNDCMTGGMCRYAFLSANGVAVIDEGISSYQSLGPYSKTINAPLSAGNYSVAIIGSAMNAPIAASSTYIPYTVVSSPEIGMYFSGSPVVNGSCALTHYNCSAGISYNEIETADSWFWKCRGTGGGSSASCSQVKPPLNGVCSPNHYLCSVGTTYENFTTNTDWTWKCKGVGTGSQDASCSEKMPGVNGQCGSVHYQCFKGTVANKKLQSGEWTWNCVGVNGGTTDSCSEESNN